ncbi:hypothetical protein Ae201684P_020292 [Aphanomyces euteiches]|nr:hypothetical protein Ae201684P_020292 [Aphanomyces euteiches]
MWIVGLQMAVLPLTECVHGKCLPPPMKIAATLAFLSSALVAAQQVGTFNPEVHPVLTTLKCSATGGCTPEVSKVVADANYRWVHNVGGSTSCQNNGQWNSAICPDAATCAKNCAIEGSITTSSSTKNSPLTSMSPTFLGGNAALYFVPMAQDGGKVGNNNAGAAYGTGYCDAQCPGGINFINGQANLANKGQCCAEMDIWEANKFANAFTPHPCTIDNIFTCSQECNSCDKGGCGVNPYGANHQFYGPGSSYTVDTTKPFSVVTQFITDDNTANGNLVQINRFYVQNGKNIASEQQITNSFCNQNSVSVANGGLKAMGRALKTGMALAISVWTGDMAWLDSGANGPCPSSPPTVTSASYSMTNIRVGDIGSTTNAVVPPTPSTSPSTKAPTAAPVTTQATSVPVTSRATSAPTSAPTTAKPSAGAVGAWGQCGGNNYAGPTACISGYKCNAYSGWYSQCIPN